ncbi:hypothetical protein [Roseibium sp.]|uniref:hypothetical protein n=1 Tax=Roseibium sp. TaxID=1936156 RepID=UPI003A97C124
MKTPLQNRVLPTGEIVSLHERGLFMGNRGGRIHDPSTRTLLKRRWSSRRWICCETSFKGRKRDIMGQGYTELFFLDEVTSLAAGHRPCFECRRTEAKAFLGALDMGSKASGRPSSMLSTDDMDHLLHEDRLDGRKQRTFRAVLRDLPPATMLDLDGTPIALHERGMLLWTPAGYQDVQSVCDPAKEVTVLTPRATVAALAAGYRPAWHPTAEQIHFQN